MRRRTARWRSSRRASARSGRRAATTTTSVRAAWGMFYDTPHLFFNTRFANNPPWGAQITIPNPAGGLADPYLGYPGGNPFPALNTDWATAAVPGVRRLRQHADRHGADGAAAVERQRAAAVRRVAGVGELSRQPHVAPVARDRAQPGGVRTGRDDRQHQSAPRADPAERGRRASSTARSVTSTTPAAATTTACCCRCSAG